MLDCTVPSPPPSEVISDSSYSNQACSVDGGTESLSVPFEIDTTSTSDIDQEPLTFSTFFNGVPHAGMQGDRLDNDPTQVRVNTNIINIARGHLQISYFRSCQAAFIPWTCSTMNLIWMKKTITNQERTSSHRNIEYQVNSICVLHLNGCHNNKIL